MEWFDNGWGITLATFLPIVGAIVLLFLPNSQEKLLKATGTLFAAAALVVGVIVALRFDYGASGEMQLGVDTSWIPQINSRYIVGIDGISLPLFVLSLLVSLLCMIYLWWHVPSPGKPKALLALVLLLETGMTGSFVALDLILFFVFWELVLVPMYFMIGIWGGPRRQYASVKFFLYTLFGSLFMLLGFLAIYLNSEPRTFDMLALTEQGVNATTLTQNLIFLGLFLGFAVKVPMWPFHTWLPDAHTEAPTVGSVLLAGVLLKLGTYGFYRFNLPMFPKASMDEAYFGRFGVRSVMVFLAIVSIIYGALAAMYFVVKKDGDVKKLVAYSSVSSMGMVMLGLFSLNPNGVNGAALHMINHGIYSAALFLLVGIIY